MTEHTVPRWIERRAEATAERMGLPMDKAIEAEQMSARMLYGHIPPFDPEVEARISRLERHLNINHEAVVQG